VSAKSIRGRFLLGVLFHVAIGLFGCAGNFAARRAGIPILGECGLAPSFAQATQLKRWQSFPIDVAVDVSSFPAEFRKAYLEGVARGAGLWSEATGGRIGSVRIHYEEREAPISISLSEIPLPDRAIGATALNVMGSRILSATVSLTRSRFEGTAFLAQDVASTTAHEMGHALGIVDHSPQAEDKMWVSGNFGVANEGRDPSYLITPSDVNTLEEAYCRR
jgi:predicted Zn-dependent protease